MGAMKKKKIRITLLFILFFSCIIWVVLMKNHTIKYELVEECESTYEYINNSSVKWFTLRSEKYNGFYSENMLKNYNVKYKKFDYKRYTYIVVIGHKMKRIEYNYKNMKNRKLLFIPKQFVGIIYLELRQTNKVYIYKINKMDIDCDYHNPTSNIYYLE